MAVCDECGGPRGTQSMRLNPVNLHPTYRRLCWECMEKLGFTQRIYSRRAASSPFYSTQRGKQRHDGLWNN